MAEITDRVAPDYVPSTNELDKIPDDLLGFTPPAYLSFGTTPSAMENPPAEGDTLRFVMRVKCTGEHGPVARKDGEKRYKRDLTIQAFWIEGEDEPPLPPDPEEPQPALFGDDEPTGEPEKLGDIVNGVDQPGFSSAGE